MQQPYNSISAFFDCYGLSNARSILCKMIKTADSEISWKSTSPSHLLYFTEKMKELIKAAFSIVNSYDYKNEVILQKQENEHTWSLKEYQHYCSSHVRYTPWHFFPRYLSKKEFLDPYKALEKFTQYQSLAKWKHTLKELLHHALSSVSIHEFNEATGILHIYIHLHKLIEATHLIAIRSDAEQPKSNILKWKDRIQPESKHEVQQTSLNK